MQHPPVDPYCNAVPSTSQGNPTAKDQQGKSAPDGSYCPSSSALSDDSPTLKQYSISDVEQAPDCGQNPRASGVQIINAEGHQRRFSWGAVMPLRLIILFTYSYLLKQAKNQATQQLRPDFDIDKVLQIPIDMQAYWCSLNLLVLIVTLDLSMQAFILNTSFRSLEGKSGVILNLEFCLTFDPVYQIFCSVRHIGPDEINIRSIQ